MFKHMASIAMALAVLALGSGIAAIVLQHSGIDSEQRKIAALSRDQARDQKAIARLGKFTATMRKRHQHLAMASCGSRAPAYRAVRRPPSGQACAPGVALDAYPGAQPTCGRKATGHERGPASTAVLPRCAGQQLQVHRESSGPAR
jgi:hypothetical protein